MKGKLPSAALAVLALVARAALAWGPDGHSIVGEIAHRRLSPEARAQVAAALGPGHSLASEGSWADDVRPTRPGSFNWHFVDIPIGSAAYDAARHCAPTPKGDCIVAELERLRSQLRCGSLESRREALLFATHLVADIHQPFHTVAENHGGNGIKVDVAISGARCPRCALKHTADNLHGLWDTTLIAMTAWSWGAYVARLESGWLASAQARGAAQGTPEEWAVEAHAVAREAWSLLRDDRYVDDTYYAKVLPLLDLQLGRAGLRLARFLEDAYSAHECPEPARRRDAGRTP